MKYGRIVTKDRLKYYEVVDNVFAAISPHKCRFSRSFMIKFTANGYGILCPLGKSNP